MDFASLVVLSYLRPDHLHRSLVSLMNSVPKVKFEVIVVDDGSRDANWPFLMQAARQRDLSTVMFNAGLNLGVGVGMNRGFSVARGKWVAKLDADLEYHTGWLDAGVALLEDFPNVGVVGFFDYHNYVRDDPRFNRLSELRRDDRLRGYVVDDFVGSAFLIRRADWLKYGVVDGLWRGFEEGSDAFAEDVEWKKRMQGHGYDLAILERDYVTNFGFGLGNSTVVVPDGSGGGKVAKITKQPLLFGGQHGR